MKFERAGNSPVKFEDVPEKSEFCFDNEVYAKLPKVLKMGEFKYDAISLEDYELRSFGAGTTVRLIHIEPVIFRLL